MAKDTVKLNDKITLKRSKELAAQYSQLRLVKLDVWKDLREKQRLIRERLHDGKTS